MIAGWRARLYELPVVPSLPRMVNRRCVALIGGGRTHRYLDVACGTGVGLACLLGAGAQGAMLGLDASMDMLRVARSKLAKVERNRCLSVGVSEALPCRSDSVDCVLSVLAFHHLPGELKRATLREIYRVLRPGGMLALSDFGPAVGLVGQTIAALVRRHAFAGENLDGTVERDVRSAGFRELRVVARQLGVIQHIQAVK